MKVERTIGLLLLISSMTGFAQAQVYIGTATGGVAVHFNDNGLGEVAGNLAYMRSQVSVSNTNGAIFNFDPALGVPPGYGPGHLFQAVPDQFGVDLVVEAVTSDGSVPTPTLYAYSNSDNTLAGAVNDGPIGWAINSYTGTTDGPADPSNGVINSLLRGMDGGLTINDLSVSGTLFTIDMSGWLETDGLIHWYNPAYSPTSFVGIPFMGYEATGRILFEGTLVYDSSLDTTPLVDFYAGPVDFYLEVVPEPSSFALALCGLAAIVVGGTTYQRIRKK